MVATLALRLGIWFLLTADLSFVNIVLGITIALLLPGKPKRPIALRDWLRAIGRFLVVLPQAYFEAVEIILFPHNEEAITLEPTEPRRAAGLVFWDIFLICFTPKSIVMNYHEAEGYQVHWVRRRSRL
jgi:multicomponent Na+:H+ antiporter subunit E